MNARTIGMLKHGFVVGTTWASVAEPRFRSVYTFARGQIAVTVPLTVHPPLSKRVKSPIRTLCNTVDCRQPSVTVPLATHPPFEPTRTAPMHHNDGRFVVVAV